ncbi:MAG: AraC family transcriptional regulator ligand-binding domain-containing protein [Myxococcota bacterium]
MEPHVPRLAVQYVRLTAEYLRGLGVDTASWLEGSGLAVDTLDDPEAVIRLDVFAELSRNAVAMSGEPALGIVVGSNLVTSTHGALGMAAVSAASMAELLDLLRRFIASRISVLGLTHEVEGERVRIEIRELLPLGYPRTMVLEAVMLSVKNVLHDASMGACQLLGAEFPFPTPEYLALAEEAFGCPLVFDSPRACFWIPRAALARPPRMADPRALELAARLCERELDALGSGRSFEIRVRRIMLERPLGFPSFPTVARRLHVTPRTLDRRLRAEGTSYRTILDDLRRRMATDHLESGTTIDEIAYLLGYTDTANFRRAFRRWTGSPPSRFRRDATK